MRRFFLHTVAALLPTAILAATSPAPAPAVAPPGSGPECEALAASSADTTISSKSSGGRFVHAARWPAAAAAETPAFCQVHGVLAPTPHSTIHFEVWLPAAD